MTSRMMKAVAALAVALSVVLAFPAGTVMAAAPTPQARANHLLAQLAKAPSLDAAIGALSPADRTLVIEALTPVTEKVTVATGPTGNTKSLGLVSPAVVGSGCWTFGWINHVGYNMWGSAVVTYSNKFFWCSNGSVLTNQPTRWETGSVQGLCWVYNGVYYDPTYGGQGSTWYESYSQGYFSCTSLWITIQTWYPAIDVTIYAYGNPTYHW
ncbi:MAG: hypothetical protein ABSE70_04650 [Candidatus Limnocylindrales bacterium]